MACNNRAACCGLISPRSIASASAASSFCCSSLGSPAPFISTERGLVGERDGVALGDAFSPLPEFSPGDGDGVGFSPDSPGLGEGLESSPGLGVGDSPAPCLSFFFCPGCFCSRPGLGEGEGCSCCLSCFSEFC